MALTLGLNVITVLRSQSPLRAWFDQALRVANQLSWNGTVQEVLMLLARGLAS